MRPVVRLAAATGMMAAVLALVQAQAPAQGQQPVFRTASDLVTMDVTVTINGTPVGALRANDFVLTDNGVRQEIESIEMTEVPAEVTIVMDLNHMMADTLRSVVPDIRRIVSHVRPGDLVRVMTIDTYVRDLVPRRAVDGFPVIERLDTNDLASTHDALAAALMRHHDTDRQHLIVAVTNGVDTSSVLDIRALEEIAKRSSASLYIVTADLFLEVTFNRKFYTTRWERLKAASQGISSRMWRPHHDREFDALEALAAGTGGAWTMPGLFSDQNAGVIFRKFYERSQRSYRLRYVPAGVAREGWHDVTVTVPKYPSYRIAARPGYTVDRPAPPAPPPPPAGSLADLIGRYGEGDITGAMQAFRASADPAALVRSYMDGLHAWPDAPQRESAFVLDLAYGALSVPTRGTLPAIRDLLSRQRRLVRDPLGPDSFERFWLWTASAMSLGFSLPELTTELVDSALARFPDEPRLLLVKAVSIDRQYPQALSGVRQSMVADRRSPIDVLGRPVETRVVTTPLVPERHVQAVLAAYDAAAAFPATRAEAGIRKAWVLHRLERHDEALALLEHVSDPADPAMEYLRYLFQGRVLDALERAADAREAYRLAHSLAPEAQSARVALLRHAAMVGDQAEAASLAEAVHTTQSTDPWWAYWQGDFRLVAGALARMRETAR